MTLHEEFNSVKKEAIDLINKAKAESRDLTAEEKESNDKRFARLDAIKNILTSEQKAASYELGNMSVVETFAKQAHEPVVTAKADDKHTYAQARKEVNQWIRGDNKQEFTLITTSGSSALLPTAVGQPIAIRRMNNAILAGILASGYVPMYTAGTESVSLPVFDDTANLAQNTAENSTTETDADPSVSQILLGATLYDSKAFWFSNSLLLAPGFDLLSYAEPHLEKRVDLKMQAVWTAAALATSGINNKTGSSTSGVTFADVIGWYHSVPPAYRNDIVFNCSDNLLQAIRSIVDSYGRPIYVESLSSDMPDKLLGRPVFVNTDLAAIGVSAVTGLAFSGACAQARIVTNRRLAKYVNYPAKPDQFGLELFVNAGFGAVANGVATFTQAAS
jgi:HK97 family phage major capsid protein